MLALILAGVATVAGLNFSGAFPDEVKTIGVVMPASILQRSRFDKGVAALKQAGYKIKIAPRISFKTLASVEDRARDFEDIWLDKDVDLVLCARGGTGAQDVIKKIDWEKLRARPNQKVLGFSNITMILNAMLKENVGHPYSGSTISHLLYAKGDTLPWLKRAIAGDQQPACKLKAIKPGAFSGLPCGGHIHLVKVGIEINWSADAKGRVVFLERNNSATVEGIEKELKYIAESGYLNEAAGVIFGDVTPGNGNSKSRRLEGEALKAAKQRLETIKSEFAAKLKCPVYDGYEYGHVGVSHAVDFCRKVSVAEDGTMTWE